MDSSVDTSQTADGDETEAPVSLPWHNYAPGTFLIVPMVVAFVLLLWTSGSMQTWAISSVVLREGRLETFALHMFAHGSIIHIAMNCIALFSISAEVVSRLGGRAYAWAALFTLFGFSGLAGALIYLAFHPTGSTPMLGASGAIFGLLGFLVRFPKDGEHLISFWSPEMFRIFTNVLKDHFWLLLIFTLPPLLMGRNGGLAWEAHLGGFLVGLLACPALAQGYRRYGQERAPSEI